MDTKLKNSRKIRTILGVLVIIVVTVGNFLFFPFICKKGEQAYENMKQDEEVNEEFIREIVLGSYVLYHESSTKDFPYYIDNMIENWASSFEDYRDYIDYAVEVDNGEQGIYHNYAINSGNIVDLSILFKEHQTEIQRKLNEEYQMYVVLKYDENGKLSIGSTWDALGREDEFVKIILKYARQYDFMEQVQIYREELTTNTDVREADIELEAFPQNCQIVFGISQEFYREMTVLEFDNYWSIIHIYSTQGGSVLYVGTLIVLILAALFFTSNKSWKNTIEYKRKSFLYLAEVALVGVICILAMHDSFIGLVRSYAIQFASQSLYGAIQNGGISALMNMLEMLTMNMGIYAIWYVSILMICPVFHLGIREYMRQYSLLYLIFSKGINRCKRFWNKTKEEINALDFSDKSIKTIGKIVILNFIVLSVISCFWFLGIIALLIYSVILFFFLKKQYLKMEQDYWSLKQSTARMATGDLQYEDNLNWGVFEPLKEELGQIRNGFSKAVEEEVKSQRMKTELITNVSHDLKTPLTAITTYVELLKDSQITEEQRQSYIEILEKKSLRLKVLVEDLFEVSKANSNTMKLDFMEVDVVNLLKQVCIEHEERFQAMGFLLKWKLPEEKVILMLDNQKTYRIFENLFVNIEKYAMPDSRVFIEVNTESGVEIVIKNISAQELKVTGEEVMERFVRGDISRNTEGSGLGLAIAKSFTEAQKGTFSVMIDGDLFKVVISWKN